MTLSIPEIMNSIKQLSVSPEWGVRDNYSEFLVPLEIEGVTFQGLELRAKAYGSDPNKEVTFQIEYHPVGVKIGALSRFDWRPKSRHINKGVGPIELHYRKFELYETHFHDFDLNWLGHENRMRSGNLPVARPIDEDPNSFEELTILVENLFKVDGLKDISRPLWQLKLL